MDECGKNQGPIERAMFFLGCLKIQYIVDVLVPSVYGKKCEANATVDDRQSPLRREEQRANLPSPPQSHSVPDASRCRPNQSRTKIWQAGVKVELKKLYWSSNYVFIVII